MASAPPRLYITLYTDEDVYGEVAEQIRLQGYDAISTFEAKNMGLEDSQQLDRKLPRHFRAGDFSETGPGCSS